MDKEFSKFLSNHQSFLRQSDRIKIEMKCMSSFKTSDNFYIDERFKISKIEEKSLKRENEINDRASINEIIERAQNFAFNALLDENSNDEITIHSLSFLFDTVEKLGRDTNIFDREDVILSIIDLIYHPNPEIRMKTLNLILLLTHGSRKPTDLLIENGILLNLLEIIESNPENESILNIIILIASNISSLGSIEISKLIQLGYSNLLLKAIDFGNINIQIACALFSANIMTKGSISDIQSVINLKIINKLFQFLDEDYNHCLIHCILDGLVNCLQNNVLIENIQFSKIFDQEYSRIICSLASSNDERSAELSQCIIYFLDNDI